MKKSHHPVIRPKIPSCADLGSSNVLTIVGFAKICEEVQLVQGGSQKSDMAMVEQL